MALIIQILFIFAGSSSIAQASFFSGCGLMPNACCLMMSDSEDSLVPNFSLQNDEQAIVYNGIIKTNQAIATQANIGNSRSAPSRFYAFEVSNEGVTHFIGDAKDDSIPYVEVVSSELGKRGTARSRSQMSIMDQEGYETRARLTVDIYEDYYKILQVVPDADKATLKKAYRKIAFEFHPLYSENRDPESQSMYWLAAEAYDILVDPFLRRFYDSFSYLRNPQRVLPAAQK